MSDRELVAGYQEGDKKAWDTLCEQYTVKLSEFFKHKVGNPEDAKDLTQDTLIEAMLNISRLENPESFRGWLYKIASGHLAKYFRDKYRRGIHKLLDDVSEMPVVYAAPAYQQPEARVISQERLEIVHSLVSRLPRSECEVFRLKLADPDMMQKEIAETLGISVSAVKVRVNRGRKKLEKWLEAEHPGEFTYLFE